jgi:hypothetical protein
MVGNPAFRPIVADMLWLSHRFSVESGVRSCGRTVQCLRLPLPVADPVPDKFLVADPSVDLGAESM